MHTQVGTPGRVLDLVESGKLKLQDVQFFVLDEADRLLDTGNQQAITKLHTKIKKFCAQAAMPDGFTGRPLQVRWSRAQPSERGADGGGGGRGAGRKYTLTGLR